MNNKYGLIGVVMTVLIGVILIGTVLAPTVEGIQKTAGDEITLTNNSAIVLREMQIGDVLQCTVIDANNDTWTLNGEPITNLSQSTVTWNVGIISDGIYLQINSGANSSSGSFYDMALETPTVNYLNGTTPGTTYTFTAEEDDIVVVGNSTIRYPYTWGYVVCTYEDGQYYSAESTGSGICSSADDLILCGTYTSGELDTAYAYRNGQTYVSNTAYSMSIPYELSLHEGTTDIYDIDVTVTMTDGTNTETFTPYRIYLPYEVTGHEASGAEYTLYGVVIVLFVIVVFMVAVRALMTRERD